MNERARELERLERATSPGPARCTNDASDEAALHEGWQALGQLVARAEAESQFDEQEFLATISQAPLFNPAERRALMPRRTWLAMTALAASLAICAAAVAYVASFRENAAGRLVKSKGSPESRSKIDEQPALAQASGMADYEWDDALDERISLVNQTLFHIQSTAPTGDDSLHSLGERLEQFRRDIDESAL